MLPLHVLDKTVDVFLSGIAVEIAPGDRGSKAWQREGARKPSVLLLADCHRLGEHLILVRQPRRAKVVAIWQRRRAHVVPKPAAEEGGAHNKQQQQAAGVAPIE